MFQQSQIYSFFKIAKNYIDLLFKAIQDYIIIFFFEIIRRKQTSKINQTFIFTSNIKSMNPIQKYQQIIELSACILNMFVFVFLCPINLLISLGTCAKPKLSK